MTFRTALAISVAMGLSVCARAERAAFISDCTQQSASTAPTYSGLADWAGLSISVFSSTVCGTLYDNISASGVVEFQRTSGVIDLAPLRFISGLKTLAVMSGPILGLSPLSSLSLLRDLQLGAITPQAASELSQLPPGIVSVVVSDSTLSNLQWVSRLSSLQSLELYGVTLQSFAGLNNHPTLTSIRIANGAVPPTLLLSLSNLPRLEKLDVMGVGLTGVGSMQNLAALKRVHLGWNQISDVRNLVGPTNIEQLNLQGNRVSDIRPLKGLSKLVRLTIGGNGVCKLLSSVQQTSSASMFSAAATPQGAVEIEGANLAFQDELQLLTFVHKFSASSQAPISVAPGSPVVVKLSIPINHGYGDRAEMDSVGYFESSLDTSLTPGVSVEIRKSDGTWKVLSTEFGTQLQFPTELIKVGTREIMVRLSSSTATVSWIPPSAFVPIRYCLQSNSLRPALQIADPAQGTGS